MNFELVRDKIFFKIKLTTTDKKKIWIPSHNISTSSNEAATMNTRTQVQPFMNASWKLGVPMHMQPNF